MSWIERCYEVYENNTAFIGDMHTGKVPLVPFAHTIQDVHVIVRINAEGKFKGASVLGKGEVRTIIPCTEKSLARTSGVVPHPLVDKLQYVAGDYQKFGGDKESGWEAYIQQLKLWCNSSFGNNKIKSILSYMEKGRLIEDLVKEKILYVDFEGKLLKKWNGCKDEIPLIFEMLSTNETQYDVYTRFMVDGCDISQDESTWRDFINYYSSMKGTVGLCYVTGKNEILSSASPKNIRFYKDTAKLISKNNSANFRYRNWFETADQIYGVSIEVNQKAHSALSWLIGLQGKNIDGKIFLVWGTKNEKIPNIIGNSNDLVRARKQQIFFGDIENDEHFIENDEEKVLNTRKVFAKRFNKMLAGYRTELTVSSKISVIVLDSGSKGRIGIRYYKELSGSRLLECLEKWHRTYSWNFSYKQVKNNKNNRKQKQNNYYFINFVGAPSLEDIAKSAYGEQLDDKLKKQTIERILPCIIDGKLLPKDILKAVVRRAIYERSLESCEKDKIQQIGCALIRGYYKERKKEVYSMALDESIRNRSYMFGRILACAEQVERHAESLTYTEKKEEPQEDKKRTTNAERLMVSYTMHPISTLMVLQAKLRPYVNRVKAKTGKDAPSYLTMLSLIDDLGVERYTDGKLEDIFLLGYASQKINFLEANRKYNLDKCKLLKEKE